MLPELLPLSTLESLVVTSGAPPSTPPSETVSLPTRPLHAAIAQRPIAVSVVSPCLLWGSPDIHRR